MEMENSTISPSWSSETLIRGVGIVHSATMSLESDPEHAKLLEELARLEALEKALMESKYAAAPESVVVEDMADDDLQILFVKEAKNAIREALVKNEVVEEEVSSPTKVCDHAPAEPTYPEPQDHPVETEVTVPAEIPEDTESPTGLDPMDEETTPSEPEAPVLIAFPWNEEDDGNQEDDESTVGYPCSKSMLPGDTENADEMMKGQATSSGEVPTDPADSQVPPSNPPAPTPPVPQGGMAPTGIPQPPALVKQDPGQSTEQGGASHGASPSVEKTTQLQSMPPPPVPTQKKRSRGDQDPYFETLSIPPPVLSDNAIYNRLYRVFKAKKDGTYDVDEKWVKAWQDVKDGRSQLYSMFEKTGYSVEKFVKRCKAITESISEESSEVEGEWLTYADMQKLEFSETKIKGVIRYCESRPHLQRMSKYGEGQMYWTEIRCKGSLKRSKRHIYQEIAEWDEANDPSQPSEKPSMDWTMLTDKQSGVLALADDVKPEETEMIAPIPVDAKATSEDPESFGWSEDEVAGRDGHFPVCEVSHASCCQCAWWQWGKGEGKGRDTTTRTSAPEPLLLHLAETMGDGATAVSAKRAVLAVDNKPDANPCNAERDFERLWQRKGYTIPIPIHHMDHQDATSETGLLRTHHVKPQDWVKYWMDTSPETIGGYNKDAQTNFSAFWSLYRLQHPEHRVFQQHGGRLHRVVPMCIHGDEGRAVKRTNFLVCSVESVLGSLPDGRVSQGCSCEAKLMSRPSIPTYEPDIPPPAIDPNLLRVASEQLTNFKGHSYLSRMLIFGVGGWVYKKHPHIVDALFEELSKNMTDLFDNGVKVANGDTYYAACVAVKGDMDFHAKVMDLVRSYRHVGTKNRLEICHMCHAGNPECSFEDFRESPDWLSTLFKSRPWDTDTPPSLCQVPFDDQSPERVLQGDTFHLVKLGIARDVIGGVLILLLRLKFFDYEGQPVNLDSRFQRAHTFFALWCSATGKTPGLRSFTPSFFNMKKGLMSAPWASTKGSDSILCLEWLVFTLNQQISHDTLLKQMLQVCEACLGVNMVHSHGLWLKRPVPGSSMAIS
eukprot:s5325_g1.t3